MNQFDNIDQMRVSKSISLKKQYHESQSSSAIQLHFTSKYILINDSRYDPFDREAKGVMLFTKYSLNRHCKMQHLLTPSSGYTDCFMLLNHLLHLLC